MKKLSHDLRKVAIALYSQLDTPVALSCLILLREGEWGQLATKSVDPRNYVEGPWGAVRYFRDSQAANFLRKSPLLPGFDPKSRRLAAEKAFDECETQCKITNYSLELLETQLQPSGLGSAMLDILSRTRKILKRILGPLPDDLPGRFGPGTCVELKGSVHTTVLDKMYCTPTATQHALAIFEHDYWRTLWGRQRLSEGLPLPGTSRGNRFTTVKKDALKDRGICIEPVGNLWCQLAVGGQMKRQAASVGLHIGLSKTEENPLIWKPVDPSPKGQLCHREMARLGSLGKGWSTIDLSNASDTVATVLVRLSYPDEWFSLLYALRSPYTLKGGVWQRLEKFSSMGNGFTFELESLLFAALIAAGTGLKVGVSVFAYGDDIIVPDEHASSAMAILRAFGFTPNPAKTFTSGPFRESCGGDYFSGIEVRSCYADSEFESPLDWYVLHNQLLARGLSRAARRCVENIPVEFRCFGPRELGDQVLHSTQYRVRVSKRDPNQHSVLVLKACLPKVPLSRWSTGLWLAAAVTGTVTNKATWVRPDIPVRGRPVGHRKRLASVMTRIASP